MFSVNYISFMFVLRMGYLLGKLLNSAFVAVLAILKR